MAEPLPPLGLDDIRVAEPDRDSEAEFSPEETWFAACDAVVAGHTPQDVATLLMALPEHEVRWMRDWWREECREVAREGQGRDAMCADLLLCRELNAQCGNGWHFPMIDPATVLDLLDERDRLRAALEAAATYLGDDSTDDSPEARATREVIREALR